MIMTSFSTFFFALLSLFTLTLTAPIMLESRDVFDPTVTYPHAGTVWIVGNSYNVTWDTSNAPVNITDKTGRVVLAKDGVEVDYNDPLAQGFDILDGSVVVQVPEVEAGSDYSIVLWGDSGNFSPDFTIEAA